MEATIYHHDMKILGKVEKNDVADIVCDICGVSTKTEFGDFEYARFSATWGYGSSKDGEHHELCLCEPCYDQVIAYIESLGGKLTNTQY